MQLVLKSVSLLMTSILIRYSANIGLLGRQSTMEAARNPILPLWTKKYGWTRMESIKPILFGNFGHL